MPFVMIAGYAGLGLCHVFILRFARLYCPALLQLNFDWGIKAAQKGIFKFLR